MCCSDRLLKHTTHQLGITTRWAQQRERERERETHTHTHTHTHTQRQIDREMDRGRERERVVIYLPILYLNYLVCTS